MRFLDGIRRLMYGRYGNDALNRLLLFLILGLLVVSSFTRISIFYWASLALLVLSYLRMFSKNIPKRYEENQQYLRIRNGFTGWFKIRYKHIKQRKDYRFFKCPTCGQKVRVPKGKGNIQITCPKCRTAFNKRS